MSERVISVSQLVRYLKSKLDNDLLIQKIQIEGEISNFTAHRSGHWYFSLKDASSRINCVMFQSYAKGVKFEPKNGDKVTVISNTSIFESAGQIQLYCTMMKPSGAGDLYVQLELLKAKLAKEGLFSQEHKKKLPAYPMKIGVIVGANTAAREDIMITLAKRWPCAEVVEFHSLVQGDTAHLELIAALLRADQANCDVLILARGGGSIEDLWAFNNEDLARYIYHLKTPLVTGVGHEVDVTIADYVADVRAATPTAAAQRATPDLREVLQHITENKKRICGAVEQALQNRKDQLNSYQNRRILNEPELILNQPQMKLDYLTSSLHSAMNQKLHEASAVRKTVLKCTQLMNDQLNKQMMLIQNKQHRMNTMVQLKMQNQKLNLQHSIQTLDAYSPLKVLMRGYSITTIDNQPISSISQVQLEDEVQIRVSDGQMICKVLDKGELS